MNLDRLFRRKNGELSNIVPLPLTKMSPVTSRSNMIRTLKGRDKIHDVIEEFNNLLRIMKLKRTVPRIGVRGKNFTKAPTLEELMGIKLKPKKTVLIHEEEEISE